MFLNKNNETKPIPFLSKKRVLMRRIKVFGLMFICTFLATIKWAEYMPTHVNSWIHWLLIILFALTFGWIALYFFSALFGFWELMRPYKYEGLLKPKPETVLNAKSVVLIPVYNENPVEIYSRILAMAQDLATYPEGKLFDFFVLSDTTQPDIWVQEEVLWFEVKNKFPSHMNLFYRHRPRNTAKKSGNIEDFCVRFGHQYDFMLVLDADSLMTAPTMIQMAKLMQLNQTTGIIQVPPMIVNAESFFARMHQYAGRVYGQIIAAGLSYWQAWDSNYWGHNAIIRVRAFVESCGLPILKGKAPFGGHILSHDFVEAALIRRSGWLAWMLPELKGSYEECPPTLLDFAVRDRRWCQGNLQHIRILLSQKLHPISRIHFLLGIMSYLSSLLWFLFLMLGIGIVIWRYFYPPVYFSQVKELFPSWPVFNVWGAITLFLISMVMLFSPKILGVLYVFLKEKKAFGRHNRLFLSFLLESLLSALLAPVMMLFQTRFILEIFLGLDSGWKNQNRTRDTSWLTAIKRHSFQTIFGMTSLFIVYRYAHSLFYWILPVMSGLILSIPLSVWISRVKVGRWFQKRGIFVIPEERKEPPLLTETKKYIPHLQGYVRHFTVAHLLKNPLYLSVHIYLLGINGPSPVFDQNLLQRTIYKLQTAINGGPFILLPDEAKCLLYHPVLMEEQALLLA